ncbi:MAG: Jag N-terminal domain-containing protein [Chloroflexi bacterium]|nr:Jag N-terminal domain-containing protein [Chloroflexota bacterium]
MSAYREFTGKSVEEALRTAREEFGAGLEDLDFEILTPGSRGVLGMGAEPARIVAAPRSELGGAAPKREAAAARPLPAPVRDDRPAFGERDRAPRRDDRGGPGERDRGPRRDDRDHAPRRPDDRGPRPERVEQTAPAERTVPGERTASTPAPATVPAAVEAEPARAVRPLPADRDRGPRRDERGGARRPAERDRGPQSSEVSASEAAEVSAARGSLAAERADLEASEASPESLAAGKAILEELMRLMDLDVRVEVETGDTSRLNVVGEGDAKEALGALIGRKGERLSALQHLVNLMLSRKMGDWTRVLVDVEDYRGRRERQLRDLALRAAEHVATTGKMLQLETMPALERRWVHIALRDHPTVATQSIGEEPNRRIVVLPRGG